MPFTIVFLSSTLETKYPFFIAHLRAVFPKGSKAFFKNTF